MLAILGAIQLAYTLKATSYLLVRAYGKAGYPVSNKKIKRVSALSTGLMDQPGQVIAGFAFVQVFEGIAM
jgi:hypothetical protein